MRHMVLRQVAESEKVDWSISQLKQARTAEQINQQRHALLEAVVEGTTDVLFVKDRQGRYLLINSLGAQLLGKSVQEVLGKDDLELFTPETAAQIMEHDRGVIATGRSKTFEHTATSAGITRTWLRTNGPYYNQKGEVVGIIGIARDITESKRAILSRRVFEIQEDERRHLARELHDEIGQVLSTISVNLHVALAGSDVRPRLEENIGIVDQAIQQVRNLSLNLRPSMLDDLGLIATVRWVADRQAQLAGFVLSLATESTGRRLPADVETASYRVVQEALTNVVRHARANQVWVNLEDLENEVRLEIRDDGAGFDVASARDQAVQGTSFGILGMQERVELLGGTIEIQSRPGQGTTIRARLPIESSPANTKGSDEADPGSARR